MPVITIGSRFSQEPAILSRLALKIRGPRSIGSVWVLDICKFVIHRHDEMCNMSSWNVEFREGRQLKLFTSG